MLQLRVCEVGSAVDEGVKKRRVRFVFKQDAHL